MPRIRTIKPEFPQGEKVGGLSRDARLLFIQLWTISDDHGRMRGAHQYLVGQLYPYDDDAIDLIGGWLSELEDKGCIRQYAVGGGSYIYIPGWAEHQRVDNAGKSRLPEFSRRKSANRREPPLDLGPSTIGPSTEDIRAAGKPACTPSNSDFERFQKAYPKRKGGQGWPQAQKIFEREVKSGADPGQIIDAARKFGAANSENIGTTFIPMCRTWLHGRSWLEFIPTPEEAARAAANHQGMLDKGYNLVDGIYQKREAAA